MALVMVPALAFSTHGTRRPDASGTDALLKVLVVAPYEGRNGATFFVSGSGFEANQLLDLTVACPRWDDPNAGRLHNFDVREVQTDAHGDFAGFPYSDFHVHGVTGTPCQVYATYNSGPSPAPFVQDIAGVYQVVPHYAPIARAARMITGHVTVRPQKVHAGFFYEQIRITKSWGGAIADVQVTDPHLNVRLKSVRLDWKGTAQVRIPVDARAAQPGLVRVGVHFRLGGMQGMTRTSFLVIR